MKKKYYFSLTRLLTSFAVALAVYFVVSQWPAPFLHNQGPWSWLNSALHGIIFAFVAITLLAIGILIELASKRTLHPNKKTTSWTTDLIFYGGISYLAWISWMGFDGASWATVAALSIAIIYFSKFVKLAFSNREEQLSSSNEGSSDVTRPGSMMIMQPQDKTADSGD